MSRKFLILVLVLLNFALLIGYNNCGQLNNNRTSTQATNPGDFGGDGDDGDGSVITAQGLIIIGLRVCTKMAELGYVSSSEECTQYVYDDIPTASVFGSPAISRSINDLIPFVTQMLLVIHHGNYIECVNNIQSFMPNQNTQYFNLNGDKDNSTTTTTPPSYNSDMALIILTNSLGCSGLFGAGSSF